MYCYLKPESARQHPEATVRPWALCSIHDDALSFASALGYVYALLFILFTLQQLIFRCNIFRQRTQLYKKGYAFRRGPIVIHMFQQEQVESGTGKPIPAHVDTLWEVEVKTANPVRNTQENPISKTIEAVLEVQTLMKGLLDLRRKDA